MPSYQYRTSHCRDKTILRPSYRHNGIFYTNKMISQLNQGLDVNNIELSYHSTWWIALLILRAELQLIAGTYMMRYSEVIILVSTTVFMGHHFNKGRYPSGHRPNWVICDCFRQLRYHIEKCIVSDKASVFPLRWMHYTTWALLFFAFF